MATLRGNSHAEIVMSFLFARPRSIVVVMTAAVVVAACSVTRAPGLSFGLHASKDLEVIERGRYLVQGPAHCASCHGDPDRDAERRAGREVPLSGGRVFDVGAAGAIVAPNITSDVATGIGGVSDDALVRSLRYGISRHGRPLAPFMSYADLADADMVAILSYLRALPAVKHETPPSRLSWLGSFGMNFILDPQEPAERPPARRAPARTPEYGEYLARTVANCYGCHTARSRLTGAFTGPPFEGGMKFVETTGTFVAPDLTPAARGVMDCAEQAFIARFRIEGRALGGSPMPWEAYARLTDDDLGAIYRYLRTLPPSRSARRLPERQARARPLLSRTCSCRPLVGQGQSRRSFSR